MIISDDKKLIPRPWRGATIRRIANGIPEKILAKKIVLKKQAHLNENWVGTGGGGTDRPLLLLLLALYLHFFDAHPPECVCTPFLFFLRFSFFGKLAGGTPFGAAYMNTT